MPDLKDLSEEELWAAWDVAFDTHNDVGVKAIDAELARRAAADEALAEEAREIGRSNAAMCIDQRANPDDYHDNTHETALEYNLDSDTATEAFAQTIAAAGYTHPESVFFK
jgi:hypothetical protein